jgi:S-adenosylmethionine:tRNA ribosyltransferase-isomerase
VADAEALAVQQWEPYEGMQDATTSEALQGLLEWMGQQGIDKLVTKTGILIAPGYRFKIVHGLITNFHQPQSTLLLLVSALIGEDWRKVYDYALGNGFRFLSYGDSSLLWGRATIAQPNSAV